MQEKHSSKQQFNDKTLSVLEEVDCRAKII